MSFVYASVASKLFRLDFFNWWSIKNKSMRFQLKTNYNNFTLKCEWILTNFLNETHCYQTA